MGIRIKRVIGYGLVDLKENDPRLNPEGMFFNRYEDRYSFDSFKTFINDQGKGKSTPFDLILLRVGMDHEPPYVNEINHHSIINFDDEFGLPSVVCFVPPSHVNNWIQSDTMVDYYMDGFLNRQWNVLKKATVSDGSSWCQILDVPLYPHEGYMEKGTGVRCDKMVHEHLFWYRTAEDNIRRLNNAEYSAETQSEILKNIRLKEDALKQLECEHDWSEKYIPMIPEELVVFFKWANMFTSTEIMYTLQPMIYTWWS